MNLKQTYYLILLLLLSQVGHAQVLLEHTRVSFILSNGVQVDCFKTNSSTNEYYYLPTNLKFAKNKAGDRSELMMIYKNDKGQIEGAIMHWLLTWGLDKSELTEARNILKSKSGSNAVLNGGVETQQHPKGFIIKGKSKLTSLFNKSIASKGKVPIIPNSKMAIAFKINKENAVEAAQLLQNNKEKLGTTIQFGFKVTFRTQYSSIISKNIFINQNLHYLTNNN